MARLNLTPDMIIESDGSRKEYRLLDEIGSGAFGQVWLASGKSDSNQYAVKVVRGSDVVGILPEMQQHQAALMAAGSSFVPQFYEASVGFCHREERSEFLMIVMEFVDGATAWQLSRECEMPELHARVILSHTCRAIRRFHEHGIIHRDIKGSNILVSPEGYVKLCDFGISTSFSDDAALRETAGTAAYMAPDICALGVCSIKYDEKVDVWALGILSIDLAMGRLPGEGRNFLLRMIHMSSYDVPDVLRPAGFSAEYQHLAKSCVERDPQKRPSACKLLESRCLHMQSNSVLDFKTWVQDMIVAIRQS